ncbi:MAG: alpha/beta fold hydrolase [Rhodospirillales bacterium]|nr:alpha/beta fold hydrolase [Rhodospirillales bacterium]
MKKRRTFFLRFAFSVLFLLTGSVCLLLWFFGSAFIGPFPYKNQPVPKDFPVEAVTFKDEAQTELKGWLVRGEQGKGVVLVLHGHGGNKSLMLGRVKFLNRAGYTVFVFDFQGHGESALKSVTVGYEEARNIRAALALLKSRLPGQKIAIIGPSLGGAALLVKGQVIEADTYILEGVFTTLEKTGEHRIAQFFGPTMGYILAPFLVAQTRIRLGFDAFLLAPIESVSDLKAPVLVIGGSADPFVFPEETQALFDRVSAPKELWLVEGAGHFDFYMFVPEEYERRVLEFLNKYL